MLFHKLEYIYIGKCSKYMDINLAETFESWSAYSRVFNVLEQFQQVYIIVNKGMLYL